MVEPKSGVGNVSAAAETTSLVDLSRGFVEEMLKNRL